MNASFYRGSFLMSTFEYASVAVQRLVARSYSWWYSFLSLCLLYTAVVSISLCLTSQSSLQAPALPLLPSLRKATSCHVMLYHNFSLSFPPLPSSLLSPLSFTRILHLTSRISHFAFRVSRLSSASRIYIYPHSVFITDNFDS